MNISWHTLAPFIKQYIKNRREKQNREESIQEKSEKEKKISFTSIHPSQAYIFISFKIFD
jgi:hypothetical protein